MERLFEDDQTDPIEEIRSSDIDAVGLFLQKMGRYSVPTHEEALNYARAIRTGEESAEVLELEQLDRLSASERLAHKRAVDDGQKARDTMRTGNLRLVVHLAKRFQNQGVDFSDLIQEGSFGLFRGIDKFDPDKGFHFSTYTKYWITQSLQKAIRNLSRTVRLPKDIHEDIGLLNKISQSLLEEGLTPTNANIAKLGSGSWDEAYVEELKAISAINNGMLSMDASTIDDSPESKFSDIVKDTVLTESFDSVDSQMFYDSLIARVKEELDKKELYLFEELILKGRSMNDISRSKNPYNFRNPKDIAPIRDRFIEKLRILFADDRIDAYS